MEINTIIWGNSLINHNHKKAIQHILRAALNAAAPEQAVNQFVKIQDKNLIIDSKIYSLNKFRKITLLGIGKAAARMTLPLNEQLIGWPTQGLIISKQAVSSLPSRFRQITGGHPSPNLNSLRAGKAVLKLATNLTQDDLLICCISGGGSALMTYPAETVSLLDIQTLTRQLFVCGARIDEINCIRRAVDQVKGGGLAKAAAPATVVSLILSDVVNSPLGAIASGPTVQNPTTNQDAVAVLIKYGLLPTTPPALLSALEKPSEPASKAGGWPASVQNVVVGSNALAVEAALRQATLEGFLPINLNSNWQGEAQQVAKKLCNLLKKETRRPVCWVAGGETTVTIKGNGKGGRNQELALAAAIELAELQNVCLVSLASDGEDGPTDAAGAVVTGESLQRARQIGLNAKIYLENNDSYSFFNAIGDLIKTGPTGTNVNDLIFLFAF